MHRKSKTASAIWVLACLTTHLHARELHASPSPLPGIPPTEQARTISDAAKNATAGDTVIIHGGTYRESVIIQAGGTEAKPILFTAATGEHVVVTGADQFTDWHRENEKQQIFSTPWPHRFIPWSPTETHPGDDFHLLIGRCEQVFAEHYPLRQVLDRQLLSRGTFFADLEGKRLYVWTASNADLGKGQSRIEASVRQTIWQSKGAFVALRGLHFRYAANMAQHAAVQLEGEGDSVTDCTMEYTNGVGIVADHGKNIVMRRCTIQYNGELGLSAGAAQGLQVDQCTIRGNGTKGWNRGWEGGGLKICACRGVVIQQSRFLENRGNGVWFDIGNENTTVRNCLVANNEDAGIFYEISFGLHATDNVIIGNGFDAGGGAWGAAAGIALSSSPNCDIERNLILGNKEGFNYREQTRRTPLLDSKGGDVAIWNHDQIVRNNTIAYNRDAQTWGWFDIPDGRHWPLAMQSAITKHARRPTEDVAREYGSKDQHEVPPDLSLEKLKIDHQDNIYFAAAGQGLFNWGTAWGANRKYTMLADVQHELGLEHGSMQADPGFADYLTQDFRVPADSPAIKMKAYPQGTVPDVRLGVIELAR
jgi:hypothetical protein